jgi:hypothetical protein
MASVLSLALSLENTNRSNILVSKHGFLPVILPSEFISLSYLTSEYNIEKVLEAIK